LSLTGISDQTKSILQALGLAGRFFGRKVLITASGSSPSRLPCGLGSSLGLLNSSTCHAGYRRGCADKPIAQAVLLESFPLEKTGFCESVYAMVLWWHRSSVRFRRMVTIITRAMGCYINIPIGTSAVILGFPGLEDPP